MSLDELRTLLGRHARPDRHTLIENVLIFKADRAHPTTPVIYGTMLILVAQGTHLFALGDHVYECGAGQYVIASGDLPVTSYRIDATPARPGLCFGLSLNPAAVADVLLRTGPRTLPKVNGVSTGLAVTTAPAELLSVIVRILRLLDQPRHVPALAPLFKHEIIWRLVTGEQGANVQQLATRDSSRRHVARAIRWIRENYTESFRVDEVAQQASMSLSAFYRNFQAVTGMSPIQFQKQIRLQQARLLLAANPTDIAGTSRLVGYDSPSQFSREYRRQFGVSPSKDDIIARPVARAATST